VNVSVRLTAQWPWERTWADELRDNPYPPDPTPHIHFHTHGGTRHVHEHVHPENHAHSSQTDLPAHRTGAHV
jgi:hypothetical protein